MALAFRLQSAGFTPSELSTEAAVTLEQDKEGFHITRSALTLRASVPNLDQDMISQLAQNAEQTCPVFEGAQSRDHIGCKAGLNLDWRLELG